MVATPRLQFYRIRISRQPPIKPQESGGLLPRATSMSAKSSPLITRIHRISFVSPTPIGDARYNLSDYIITTIRMKIFGIDLCRYKDLFGRPREGAHAYRIFDIAVVDVAATVVVAFIIARIFGVAFWKSLVALFLVGIISHRMFCVRTTVDKWVFPKV